MTTQTQKATDQQPEVVIPLSPEAASTNFYWTFGKDEVFNLQTTFRGSVTETEIAAHFASVKHALIQVVSLGGHAKQVGQQPSQPAPSAPLDPSAKIALEEGNKELATTLQEGQAAILDFAYDGVEECDGLTITPQAGEVVNIDFTRDGLKWPVLRAVKWKNAKAQSLLKYATSAEVTKPAKYSLACKVFYKLGKEYVDGEGQARRYKDIVGVRLA